MEKPLFINVIKVTTGAFSSRHVQRWGKQKGAVLLMAVLFFTIISVVIIQSATAAAISELRTFRTLTESKYAYVAAEAGIEDVLYRIKNEKSVPSSQTITLNNATSIVTVATVSDVERDIFAIGNASGHIRKLYMRATKAISIDFHYGVQIGDGGLIMENSSSIDGNAYSNGNVSGGGTNLIRGDAIAASTNSVSGVHSTSTVRAHTISNSTVDKDAYYQVISNTTVWGTSYPGSPDQPKADLPIPDSVISQWESDAALGGTHTTPCPYNITEDVTIGPLKITCDLSISGTPTVTLGGPVWVTGDIEIQNSAVIRVAAALGGTSVAMIAHNPSNGITSSQITLQNSTTYLGSGVPGSYVLLVSQNYAAEDGYSDIAIDVKNSASGALLVYAGHGEVVLQNNVNLKEVSAYRLRLKNNAKVVYETGVSSPLFTGGPASGTWNVIRWSEFF